MAEYIEREALLDSICHETCRIAFCGATYCAFMAEVCSAPAADVAPIEALARLRDELCEQDLITMEGLKRLNTLIWKYTTAHDGGADHAAD